MNVIQNQKFDEERALYNLKNAAVKYCEFAGPADGESALKEAQGVTAENCRFDLRYPFWHNKKLSLINCTLTENCRAAIWYTNGLAATGCRFDGIKVLRESKNIALSGVSANSPEMGWRCKNISLAGCTVNSEYFMFESRNLSVQKLDFTGKYSFQYVERAAIENSTLNTKDAFWHSKNITVKNCTLSGEYLGWYSENLTLENCAVSGTQPFCYCKNLRLINCTMENCDLAFEYSDVRADIKGEILSVKNPKAGYINAEKIGSIILENSVIKTNCKINVLSQ